MTRYATFEKALRACSSPQALAVYRVGEGWSVKDGSAAFARPLAEFNGLDPAAALVPGTLVRVPIHVPARGETARVAFVKGEVTRGGAPLVADALVVEGDVVVTGEDGFVSIAFSSGSVVNLQPGTRATLVRLSCLESDDSCLVDVGAEAGEMRLDVEARDGQPLDFRVTTPFASAAVRGTVFEAVLDPAALRAAVTEGEIAVAAAGTSVAVPEGFGSVTLEGEPPGAPVELLRAPVFGNVPTRVAEGDAVSWFGLDGAIAYSARFARDEAGVETLAERDTTATRLEIGPGLESGDYYVSLRGVDSAALPGTPSTVRLSVADIDADVAPVATRVARDGGDFLVEVVDPPPDAPGFEIQASTTPGFEDPLSLDVTGSGRAVLRLDADTLYARSRTLLDPFTVSAFGPPTSSDD